YVGVMSLKGNCPNPVSLQKRIDFQLLQNGNALTMVSREEGSAAVCTSNGFYTQSGQFGSGTQIISSCTDGTRANNVMILDQIVVSASGVTMNVVAASSNSGQNGCELDGSIYGIRQ